LWSLLYGHQEFVPIIGNSSDAADENMNSIKRELNGNDLLYEDFPEICHPIRALKNTAHRAAHQTHRPGEVDGEKGPFPEPKFTGVEWSSDKIVFPSCWVPNGWWTGKKPRKNVKLVLPPGAGKIVMAQGLMGGVLGLKHKRLDGANQRPTGLFFDDIQTPESAESPAQVAKRMSMVRNVFLRLGSHSRPIAVMLAGTIIALDDCMDQLTDHKRNPSWQSERIAMVEKWPLAHDRLWLGEYAKLRNTYDPLEPGGQLRAHAGANEFYRAHRTEMDEGCRVSWDTIPLVPGEISSIQHAYNILIDDGEESFATNCQNDPKPRTPELALAPKAEAVAAKANGIPRGVVPNGMHMLTAFMDVQKVVLPWIVVGFGAGFRGHVVDYGLYPEQPRGIMDLAQVKNTLQSLHGKELETCLFAGFTALSDILVERSFLREDGMEMRLGRAGIDENWGFSTEFVHAFCRRSKHAALLMPQDGRSYGPSSRGIETYEPKRERGETCGYGWISTQIRQSRHIVCDVNMWKSFVHRRLALPANTPGGWSLFGKPEDHAAFARQACAEYPDQQTSQSTQRTVTLWHALPGRENHSLDLLVGAAVMASTLGLRASESVPAPQARRKRVPIDELMARRQNMEIAL
jgi:hypothetical protein